MDWIIKPLANMPAWVGVVAGVVLVCVIVVLIVRKFSSYKTIYDTRENTAGVKKNDPIAMGIGSKFRYQKSGEIYEVVGMIRFRGGKYIWIQYFVKSQSATIRRFSFGKNSVTSWEELCDTNLAPKGNGVEYGQYFYSPKEAGSVEFESIGQTGQMPSGWMHYRSYAATGHDGKDQWLLFEKTSGGDDKWRVAYGCEVSDLGFEIV